MPDAAAVLMEHDATVPLPVRSAILPLETRNLVFTAGGRRLIDGIDLRLEAGRRTVIMGPNGAGKSLLLRLLHGLIDPTAGDVHWQGKPADRRARRRQAMVFQRPVMLRRSVAANMRHALRANGCSRGDAKERTRTWLAHAGLSAFADQPARTLSGGEQQRLAVARALSLEPEVLFLDEPTASLDPSSTLDIEELIQKAAAYGTKIVLVTHDIGQARRIADEVVFLYRGRLEAFERASAFFNAPGSAKARAFVEGRIVL
jgi:tungstate transport system ATP-binding protein